MARASRIPAGEADRYGRARRPASQEAARPQDTAAAVTAPGDRLARPFTVQIHRLPEGALLIQLSGPVDQASCSSLSRRVDEAGGMGPTLPRLLLDLSGVTFLDHAGLDALLRLQERWADSDGAVELLTPSASIVRLLHDAELNGESWM